MYISIIALVIASISCIVTAVSCYYNFFKKPDIKLKAKPKHCDNNKGKNAFLLPINTLEIFITNLSKDSVVIHDIKLSYKNTEESKEELLDWYAHYQLNKLRKIRLTQGEEAIFRLSYVNNHDKLVLDNLESITVILTSGHEYKFPNEILEPLIEKVKKFKPRDPDNVKIAERRERNRNALPKRED